MYQVLRTLYGPQGDLYNASQRCGIFERFCRLKHLLSP